MARDLRDGGGHGGEEVGVGVEGDRGGGPVVAVFVEACAHTHKSALPLLLKRGVIICVSRPNRGAMLWELRTIGGIEGQRRVREGGRVRGVETGFGGGWGLEDEVDRMGRGILLSGKEFDVDLAGVVEVLCDCEISSPRQDDESERRYRERKQRTQNHAPQVPPTPVNMTLARKLPYSISSLTLLSSAIPTKPPALPSSPTPLTYNSNPASPPTTPSPAQSYFDAKGFVTTLLNEAFLPHGPRAAAGVTV